MHNILFCQYVIIIIISLGQVKRRILEYLSVIKVKKDLSPPILCLVGPVSIKK